MRNNGVDVIHLVNLLNEKDSTWRNPTGAIAKQTNVAAKFYLGEDPVPKSIRVASPDRMQGRSESLAFTTGSDAKGRFVEFVIPEVSAWTMVYMGDLRVGNGNVVNRSSMCLDIAGGEQANGTPAQLWDCASVPQQKVSWADGQLHVLGKCLDVANKATGNGAVIHLWDCHGGTSQQWVRTEYSQFRHVASGRCLDVQEGRLSNGSRLHVWDCHVGASQKWSLPQ